MGAEPCSVFSLASVSALGCRTVCCVSTIPLVLFPHQPVRAHTQPAPCEAQNEQPKGFAISRPFSLEQTPSQNGTESWSGCSPVTGLGLPWREPASNLVSEQSPGLSRRSGVRVLGMWVVRTPLGQKRNTKPRVCPVRGRGPCSWAAAPTLQCR